MMKKVLLVIAALASLQIASAQQAKSVSAAKAAVEAAQAAADDAKKATKATTWLKLGQTLIDAYNAPAGNGWLGAGHQEIQLISAGEKPLSTEEVVLSGEVFSKEVYNTREYYYNANGQLAIINVIKPIYEDALERAAAAFAKAAELDTKAQKTKEISEGQHTVYSKFLDIAYNSYTLVDYKKASVSFAKAYEASVAAPYSKMDTSAIYNAGFTAWMYAKNNESDANEWYHKAKDFFNQSIEKGYFGADGEVYVKLADIEDHFGNKVGRKAILSKGFAAFPQSQSLLVSLINYYVTTGENVDELFVLLDKAKANDPKNASLYYVEGNTRKQLGDIEGAAAAYKKASEVDPSYIFGFVGIGILYYEAAVESQKKADDEMDNKKYEALVEQTNAYLKNCIEPFEKAYELSEDQDIKVAVAQYLKNACYRFVTESAEYEAKYKKYAEAAK